ncbi:MAG: phage holin family protein [Bacilli bacterium]|nr:phage holin family protein [Bacilli bacterium]MBR2892199.1 phage holin family protein [Bacilli bacterium]
MMDFTCVPIIVVCCYIVGEIYKVLFKNKQEAYKLIPILVAILGGLLGVLIYFTNPEMVLNADNVWVALGVGIVSGASSTGTNQIIKQLFKKGSTSDEQI